MQALKALVIGMGILILVAMAVLAVTIYKRATTPGGETAMGDGPRAGGASGLSFGAFGSVDLPVPAGAQVEEVDSGDGRLTLRLRLDDGSTRIMVVDLSSGALLGTLVLQPTPESGP
ncbi:MAG: hypothetical protein QF833_02305 [Alphaproteobacteria bacterium]|jgi:hypothetical protein|nr:hypothetical protein [Alphaproteobacteria bacterium]MDP7310966.1 hypothetical protein [Alphaproteobacteria bacterium]MEE1569603.1 hypothetical protein [Alphaproteobacteria bacterium]|tara:strand:- start:209 stop:559 length:351 start_codon:yes stop_codon:yes gene_type:complete